MRLRLRALRPMFGLALMALEKGRTRLRGPVLLDADSEPYRLKKAHQQLFSALWADPHSAVPSW